MRYCTFQRSAGTLLALLLILTLVGSCKHRLPKSQIDPNTYAREIEQWHQERWKELNSEDGWLTLIGLFWLKDGQNTFGSDAANDIVIPKVAAHAGSLWIENGAVRIDTTQAGFIVNGNPIKSAPLRTDDDGKPTIVRFDSLTLQIIKRNEKLGLRVKDSQNPDRLNFKGTEFYPTNQHWRINAQFETYNPPRPMPITNVLGMESAESSPGAVKFELDDKEYRLDALTEKNEPRLFVIMADKTSGKDTYPAGRYLYVNPPDASGHLTIDFNKAYSPPCAFTRFATCPLPPRQNRLPVAIEAGEKYRPHAAPTTAP